MPTITLADFVDIAHASGTPKATKIAEVKNRPEYDPRFDFYKAIREKIVYVHQKQLPKTAIRQVVDGLSDRKKIAAYPELVTAYQKWWGRKELPYFSPPSDDFSGGGLDIVVNPELGLMIGGTPHVLKLYFKAQPLSKSRVDIVTHVMEVTLGSKVPVGTTFGVVDVRRSRIATVVTHSSRVNACLRAELAYIAQIWPEV